MFTIVQISGVQRSPRKESIAVKYYFDVKKNVGCAVDKERKLFEQPERDGAKERQEAAGWLQ